jgi:3-hydroxyisobutyrate dehydrogenase
MDLTTIGFVGLGMMGNPMVRQLAEAGRNVVVFDLQADAVERVAAIEGVRAAESLAAVGAAAEVVITMLPNGSVVSAAVLGGNGGEGLAASLSPGSVVIDMSSSAPWETVELGARLDALGIRLVDAPVSGGVARAITGELAIFAGGDSAVIDQIEPVLGDMGTPVRTGPLGTGHTAKALNNLLSAACFAATIEVVKLAEAAGMDPQVMAEVLNSATGKNNTTDRKLRQFVLSETFDSGFALSLMVKDLKQSAELADRAGLELPVSRGVIDLWVEGAEELSPGADHTEIAKVIRGSTP